MISPKFSIIIPAYNASSFIERAVNSVEAQLLKDWELLIIENGSSDNTFQLCNEIANKDKRIKLLTSDKGVSKARNKGIDEAVGEWIVFLDADDELSPNALSVFSKEISDETDLIVGKIGLENSIHREKKKHISKDEKDSYLCGCLNDPTQKCTIKALAVKRVFLNINNIRFDNSLRYAEDSVFIVDVIARADNITDIPNSVYVPYVNYDSAVHTMDVKVINQYKDSIISIEHVLNLNDASIANSFHVFSLSQLLVVMVNSVYPRYSFKEGVAIIRNLCNDPFFDNSIIGVKTRGLPISRRVVFRLMKNKSYYWLGLIVLTKQRINTGHLLSLHDCRWSDNN